MDLAIRAIVLYAFVFFLTRVVGRRELSSLQPFDLILLIVLGDSIQQGLTQDDYSVTGALIVVGMIAALQVGTSYLSFRSRGARPVKTPRAAQPSRPSRGRGAANIACA